MDIEVERMQVLDIGPNDVVVLEFKRRVPAAAFNKMKDRMEKILPGIPVLVLEEGAHVRVLRQGDGKEEA